ncbi:uncharacterized protein BYT42DRAFT_542943 [Radiomyces spectabilis]|uniref:uncharacterized protein n=1 Tax=Radiomyces spectabilis TaxID=64574 RepID=UPI00221E3F15|nr:uncharacterized protein BYT42DRAFT_542943 [Radiomyces spectabilis]KAI8391385.1 hypothetical protein BYT42DRAFT_542943 [Radiomyces spectabilis]
MSGINRFEALLGDEETEVDKLGNVKPVDKKEDPKTRRDTRKLHTQPAVSPPSRREPRGRGDYFRRDNDNAQANEQPRFKSDDREPRQGGRGGFGGGQRGRGRQFDRHSGTGMVDNEKKINQAWGHLGTSELEAANDYPAAGDPDSSDFHAPGTGEHEEENVKTLDEYKQSLQSAGKPRLPEARAPNEGSDDSKWKDAVPLERNEDDSVFFAGKAQSGKARNKNKKEKVYLDIEQPPHRSQDNRGGRGRGRGGRGRGGGMRGGRGGRGQRDVNLSDAHAFPTLGA